MLSHWLYVHFGIAGSGPWYGFWSGVGSDIAEVTIFGGLLALVKKHQCHRPWCLRFGHYRSGMLMLCRKHHPSGELEQKAPDSPVGQVVRTE